MQRRDEILAKKAKLAELKRQRELRQKEFSTTRQSIGGAASPSTSLEVPRGSPGRHETRAEVDDLVASLIGGDAAPRTPPSNQREGRRPRPSSHLGPRHDAGTDTADDVSRSPKGRPVVVETGTQTLSLAPLRTVYEVRSEPPRRDVVTYSKGVQTSPPARNRSRSASNDPVKDAEVNSERRPRRRSSKRHKEHDEEIRKNLKREIEDELRVAQNPTTSLETPATPAKFPARALTIEEKHAVTSSNDFLDFVERSSKVIERALDEEYDVLADYRSLNISGLDEDADDLGATGRKGRRVREIQQFYDERWSRRRIISDISFSAKHPELLLASHTKNPSAPYDPPGIILVWNTHMPSRPEYTFSANSDILTAKFSPFHPNLILGGTYSGQVLLWDTRSRISSHHPVQKTPLTGTGYGHTHPIYSINVVGTQNAHNIISTSTDGIVCSWSVDMLRQPQEYLELSTPTTNAPPPPPANAVTNPSISSVTGYGASYNQPSTVSPLCTAFPPTDPSYFLAGTEAGPIHLIHRYDRAGMKAGVDGHTAYVGHAGPVVSLDFHRATGPLDLGDLMLSTGLDWNVRLWRVRTPGGFGFGSNSSKDGSVGVAKTRTPGNERKDVTPLLSILRDEPVYDAKWSPTRPGVWACVDGAGHLEVWDMNYELGVPVARVMPTQRREDGSVIPRDAGSQVQTGSRMNGGHRLGGQMNNEDQGKSLNKVAWESSEGKRLAVGGLDGALTLFEVGGELGGLEGVKQDEWIGVKKLVARLEGGMR